MAKSDDLENEILDMVLGGQAWSIPADVWVALYTVTPADPGGGTEVTGGSYARVQVDNDLTTWAASVAGLKENAILIAFPQATANWGDVVAFGIHRHGTNDDLLYWGPISPQRTILNGAEPEFEPGALVITES